jgi:hypothetical protein
LAYTWSQSCPRGKNGLASTISITFCLNYGNFRERKVEGEWSSMPTMAGYMSPISQAVRQLGS